MFKVLHRAPPIPEKLSPEGKDFLCCCFQRNPAERPSAMMLLEHPFVRNSNDLNVSSSGQSLSAINIMASNKYYFFSEIDELQSDLLYPEKLLV